MNYQGQYIVLDLEFFGKGKGMEIVEIAAQRVYSSDFGQQIKEGDSFKEFVKPVKNPPNSFYSLTNLDKSSIKDADTFKNVYERFMKWVNKEKLDTFVVSFGNRDKQVLETVCIENDLSCKDLDFIDIQEFDILQRSLKLLPSLKTVVESECGEFVGAEHEALADAMNTARLLQKKLVP